MEEHEEYETEEIIERVESLMESQHEGAHGEDYAESDKWMLVNLKNRLMPKGYTWPRFKEGRQVRIGDRYLTRDGSDRVKNITFEMGGIWCDCTGELIDPFVERWVNGKNALLAEDYEYLEGGTLLEAIRIAYTKMRPELNAMENELGNAKHYDTLRRLRQLFEELEEAVGKDNLHVNLG